MDQSKEQKFHNCLKHTKNKIKFIQVNEIKENPTSNLYCCVDCIDEDLKFKPINYLLIEKIIFQGENNILPKWPPVKDCELIEKLTKEISKFCQSEYVVQRITNYFTELKDQIFRKIEYCQKQMINQALDLPFGGDQIIKQYQQISQVQQLRTLVIESKNSSLDSNIQQRYREFIAQQEIKKDENTEKLQNLLNQSMQYQNLVNYEYPNAIKQHIFSFIDKINFFNKDLQKTNSQSLNNKNTSNKLIQLISNKSNYCSIEFLNSIKQQFEKLNPMFDDLNDQNMFIEGKQPVNFDLISEQKMDDINELVNHQIKLQNNQNYLYETQQNQIIKIISRVIESKTNFMSIDSQQNLKQYFIETYPILKNQTKGEVLLEQESFDLINNMDEQMIKDFCLLLRKKKQIQNNLNSSQTQLIKNQKIYKKYVQHDFDRILEYFPIFDIIPTIIEDLIILNDLTFLKGSLNDGDKRIYILNNNLNQYEIGVDDEQYQGQRKQTFANCMLNINLQKNKKYVFRIQFLSELDKKIYFQIGLMKKENLNIQEGYLENLYAGFFCEKNSKIIQLQTDKPINKYLRGNNLQIDKSNLIEFRICLDEQILQVLDYPNYEYQVSLQDEKLKQLQNMQNLGFFLQLFEPSRKYIIKDALIVTNFDN